MRLPRTPLVIIVKTNDRMEIAMKTPRTIPAGQIGRFARFLEEHPGFSPELKGEDAYVSGFYVGRCFLSVEDMEKLIATRVDVLLTARLQTASLELGKRRLS